MFSIILMHAFIVGLSDHYGYDPVVMERIIACESSNMPMAVGREAKVGYDLGLLQLNSHYHLEEMHRRGLNAFVWQENLLYGFELYERYGYQPWSASRACWSMVHLES